MPDYKFECGCDYLKAEHPRCDKHQKMMDAIHQAVWVEGKFLDETWALQDGYGIQGMSPVQGWDWSGIRDSTPSAIEQMYEVVS